MAKNFPELTSGVDMKMTQAHLPAMDQHKVTQSASENKGNPKTTRRSHQQSEAKDDANS